MINKRGVVSVLGINIRQIMSLRYFVRYFRDLRSWRRSGGHVGKYYPVLEDYADSAGTNKGHYFRVPQIKWFDLVHTTLADIHLQSF